MINDETSFDIIQKIIEDFQNNLDISDLFVPAIVYTGPEEDLPNIFYNLNTGGVNLSKYETFSSLWDSSKYKVDDSEIIDKIYEKYDQLREKSDLEVDISKEEISNEGITLFEYCYSISEILRDKDKKYNLVLGTNKKSTDPIGFEIISLIMGLDVNKADKLGLKEMSDGKKGLLVGASPKFLVDLKNVIVYTFDVICEALEYWIKAENGKNNTLDSTYMIYHMAISYIKKNYIIDKKQLSIIKTENRKWIDNYKKYLPLYYLKDYITDYWKKNRQVSDLTRLINNEESLSKYANNIDMNDWEDSLVEFRTNQLEEVGVSLSLKANLFLDYVTKYKLTKNPLLRKYFDSKNSYTIDYEHIVPQKRIEEKFGSKNKVKGYPVSSLGNICYLASTDNRSKHDKTIYEHVKDRPSFVISDEYLNLIDYPKKDELRFIDYDKDSFNNEYRRFIENRIDELINEFKELIKELY